VALGIALILWPLAPDLPPTSTQLPVFKYMLLVLPPPLYLLFVTVVVTGTSNAVNLTDGLDGLAAGLTAILAGTFAAFAYVFGRIDWTRYLLVYFLPGSQELTIFCGALAGAALGFLWFNAHPAQVFMGDTGSLAIGGALGTVAIMLKAEFLLLIAGGVFAAEAVSVMLQVWVYRWHKRRHGKEYADAHRVFRMAPLHHHFEKLGWAEPQVVMRFYILGVMCAAIALATLRCDDSRGVAGGGVVAVIGSGRVGWPHPAARARSACTRATRRTTRMEATRSRRCDLRDRGDWTWDGTTWAQIAGPRP